MITRPERFCKEAVVNVLADSSVRKLALRLKRGVTSIPENAAAMGSILATDAGSLGLLNRRRSSRMHGRAIADPGR